ncbi:gluconate 5-dehydrogenase/3-oxoacyl-[acyl-carrier protein] reductase [Tistlia consotensis]|uniref:Gluconate 5-dehydrogenase/3-oxoacyl-[acyl-carrier protein] reductase n=1 Tax=Tistlia consotensis USBA 355 TaxID=560819 RepID=A0A1Y6CKT5_9PROT|nr:SDR family oxidoreductase [Tistlia consotensis]SMF72328.1 gluconate 5-dehydrogenase/3-oxoacyl-[acyl-carrier protein] reductase [Tistlia consotensis USBA 355]SNS08854.1 gluconate 5-dehydrogenase/3-oxoacyl-[acyl-carrier protein] reductase [Tistlia consotensis]
MARQLSESAVLLTGGTAGIGLACAEALAAAGVPRLLLAGRSEARGAAAVEAVRRAAPAAEVRFVAADVATPEGATRAAEACAGAYGRIDALVSTAGGDALPRLLHEQPIESLPETLRTITSGVLLPARAVLPVMMDQGGGSIVCTASDAAKVATPGEVTIGAAMAAIVMFCRGLANEAKRSGIRVNVMTPSIVRGTPLYDQLMADPFAGRLFAKAETMARLGVAEAADLAQLAVFLCGPGSAKLTGQAISVNGGISAA